MGCARSRGRPGWARRLPQAGGCLAAAAATLILAPSAAAQDTDSARLSGEILQPVTVGNQADMDFGRIAPREVPGTVVMTASATPQCTATNGLVHLGACRAATFTGAVRFLYVLRITRPVGGQITLTGPAGATMRVNGFSFAAGSPALALGSTPTEQRYLILSPDGSFTIHVGGTLQVGAYQRPGVYNGTFSLEFNYD
ncbi:MAG TPA: DUF4402 domain-containing protein [Croceibacterium sp.]|nr:DUF4402 domain-containing protein [Croceibacterium sp.]